MFGVRGCGTYTIGLRETTNLICFSLPEAPLEHLFFFGQVLECRQCSLNEGKYTCPMGETGIFDKVIGVT